MKSLYILLILILISIPLSNAKQVMVLEDASVAENVVEKLQQVEYALANGHTNKLSIFWGEAEVEWQRLFEKEPNLGLNKIYNQLQVNYLVFQKNQNNEKFRREIIDVVKVLKSADQASKSLNSVML